MDLHTDVRLVEMPHGLRRSVSPVASARIRDLAIRVIEGAPAVTAGEMRELADAILEHNALSAHEV